MKGFLILGSPMCQTVSENYKGLYRVQPFPNQMASSRMITLWERYVQHFEKACCGITSELSLDELFLLAELSQACMHTPFEVVYFNQASECQYSGDYCGIDVTGLGGYSILGEGGFHISDACQNETLASMLRMENVHLSALLNQYGLFQTEQAADDFILFLNHLSAEYPGCVEDEHWTRVHIWKMRSNEEL